VDEVSEVGQLVVAEVALQAADDPLSAQLHVTLQPSSLSQLPTQLVPLSQQLRIVIQSTQMQTWE